MHTLVQSTSKQKNEMGSDNAMGGVKGGKENSPNDEINAIKHYIPYESHPAQVNNK